VERGIIPVKDPAKGAVTMKEKDYFDFFKELEGSKKRYPLYGQIELTYKCGYDCIHCYCKSEPKDDLALDFWRGVFDQLKKEGCLELTFTGGDPLLHKDFLRIYGYARKKGFMINLFTNAYDLTDSMMDFLEDNSPHIIEITLNSLDGENYESITGLRGSFDRTMENIDKLKKRNLPLVLKCNGLKENNHEILKIKKFAQDLLGKGKFKYDSFIYPGLKGQKEPCLHRLEPDQIKEIEMQDRDMFEQRTGQARQERSWFNPRGLYHCGAWWSRFYINPQGILQFCHLSKDFSTDLKKEPFKRGFEKFKDVLKARPKKKSGCWSCELLEYCHRCPARAFLETGDEEGVVEYYCRLARATKDLMGELKGAAAK